MFNYQDTKPLSNSKENRKLNDEATAPRRIYLFYTAFRPGSINQDTKALNRLTKYGFQQPFCMLYPHLCIQARIPSILTYSSPKEKGFESLFLRIFSVSYIKILELDIAFIYFYDFANSVLST